MSDDHHTPRRTALTSMLPSADVHVFSTEEHTQDIIESLSGDWRFGRVHLEMKGDGLDAAIALYETTKSPTALVIQTPDTGQAFQDKLDKLAAVCAEGTSALVIGPVNDVQLYRKLTALGVSDYLVHPVGLYDMAEAISRTLLSMLGASDSKLIAIIGAKGGVGTTNVAHLTASISADILEQKTVFIDAAAGQSTLWAQFGHNPTGTLVEAAKAAIDNDHDTLSRILMAISENLTFLNTGAEPMLASASQHKLFEMFLERMLGQYPVVICDLSGTSPAVQNSVLARANGVLVVSTPTINALSLTRTLTKEILAMRGNDASTLKLILNKRGEAPNFEVQEKDISQAVGYEIAATLPYYPKHFMRCESEGIRPSEGAEGKKMMDIFTGMIAKFIGLPDEVVAQALPQKQSFMSGLFKKTKQGA